MDEKKPFALPNTAGFVEVSQGGVVLKSWVKKIPSGYTLYAEGEGSVTVSYVSGMCPKRNVVQLYLENKIAYEQRL